MSFSIIPPDTFRDGDLHLRSMRPDDWTLEQALSTDPEVVRWTTIPLNLSSLESQERVERAISARKSGHLARWVITRNERCVGTAGVGTRPGGDMEVFYSLLHEGRGAGNATRATRLIADWSAKTGARVTLATIVGNVASEKTAKQAGFVRTGQGIRVIKGQAQELNLWCFVPDADWARQRSTGMERATSTRVD